MLTFLKGQNENENENIVTFGKRNYISLSDILAKMTGRQGADLIPSELHASQVSRA